MTDDIVTRLLDFTPLNDADLARLMLDAADEIERLREAGNKLAYWALQENLAGELISAAKTWKVVRGE